MILKDILKNIEISEETKIKIDLYDSLIKVLVGRLIYSDITKEILERYLNDEVKSIRTGLEINSKNDSCTIVTDIIISIWINSNEKILINKSGEK